jgi:hypothetical protein
MQPRFNGPIVDRGRVSFEHSNQFLLLHTRTSRCRHRSRTSSPSRATMTEIARPIVYAFNPA